MVEKALGRPIRIAPSILSADFARLAADIEKVEEGGADLLHLDIMDGHFVPNITIGPPVVSAIRQITKLPLDAHLMIEEPSRYLDAVVKAGASWVSVHVEADRHLNRSIRRIQELGAKAGVALNPATPLGALEEILPEVDFVLVMSVNPGFGGQSFIPSTLGKVRRLRSLLVSLKCRAEIEVDGGVGIDNLGEVLAAGAEIIVAGSAVFGAPQGPSDAVRAMRELAERHGTVLQSS